MYESNLYFGTWGELNLLFCPAEIAKNTVIQKRYQFDILVADLNKIIELTTKFGGKPIGEIVEDEYSWSLGIYDPNKNPMLFKQKNNKKLLPSFIINGCSFVKIVLWDWKVCRKM